MYVSVINIEKGKLRMEKIHNRNSKRICATQFSIVNKIIILAELKQMNFKKHGA